MSELTCTSCSETKSAELFSLDPRMKSGRRNQCKACRSAANTSRANTNRIALSTSAVAYAATHTERVCCDCKESKPLATFSKNTSDKSGLHAYCKSCACRRTAAWRDKNVEHRAAYEREYERSDRGRARRSRYYESHRDEQIAAAKAWNRANPEQRKKLKHASDARCRPRIRASYKRWKDSDPSIKIGVQLRVRLACAVRAQLRGKKDQGRGASAVRDLGCTLTELVLYLEKLFQPGMTWNNYGAWHVDHKQPLARFDLTDPAQCREVCHFTNLQPLWAADNLAKGDREA